MSAADSLISGENLACLRGDRLLFRDLAFAVPAGGAVLLTGPNGSGKTSFLRIVAGLLKPTHGTLSFRGEPVEEDPETFHAALHYIGHRDAVKPMLTVAENLTFWARLRGGRGQVGEALDGFGLSHLADLPARFLSAGQKRRLGLARLLAAPAQLWLLDEPTVSLDKGSVAALEGMIAEHRAGGGAVMAATHIDLGLDGAEMLAFGPGRHREGSVPDFGTDLFADAV